MTRRGHGEGSIYKDKSTGLYVAEVSVPGPPRTRLKKRSKTRREAIQNKEALLKQARQLTGRPEPDITVEEVLSGWVRNEESSKRLSDSTENRRRNYERQIAGEIGDLRLRDLSTERVESMLHDFASREQRPMGADSLRKALGVLKRAVDRAVARGHVDRNVADYAELPISATVTKRNRASLTPDDARRFLVSCSQHRLGDMWYLQLRLCLRPGEVAALTWGSINENTITISRTVKRTSSGRVTISDDVKTDGARRTITAPDDVLELLQRRRSESSNTKKSDLVFPSASGQPIDPGGNRRALTAHCKLNQIVVHRGTEDERPPTAHELRHTGTSLLADQGAPNELLAYLLGHNSTRMVDQVYRHQLKPTVDTAVNYDWMD